MQKFKIHIILLIPLIIMGCNNSIDKFDEDNTLPTIFPDYIDITIPWNIAPLNFKYLGKAEDILVEVKGNKNQLTVQSDKKIQFPLNEWKNFIENNKGDTLKIYVYVKENGKWKRFKPFTWMVSNDAIDTHLAYRLIEPGYVGFNEMGIYQRNLENFDEKPILNNDLTDRSCMNCHSFCARDPKKMMFHVRLRNAGTIIIDGDKIKKIDTRTSSTIAAGTYPAWHPSGKYIAFSINKPQQVFHLNPERKAEISDIESDIAILDLDRNELFSDSLLMLKHAEETFPSFTANGKKLLFATYSPLKSDSSYKNIQYSLCAIDFDPTTKKFGKEVDTLISAIKLNKTVAFANASPDGKYILCSLADHGVFTSWNKESDLYLYVIETGELKPLMNTNSYDSESYNSWSSNSHWIVFSSRRIDTHYNRPHFAHLNADGTSTKGFVMPQKDPDFYTMFLKIYNRPELIKGPVTINPYDIEKAIKSDKIIKVNFRK
ncbi:MAG: hypothetical protein U0W24_16325 [Bacteroidales bacterium]